MKCVFVCIVQLIFFITLLCWSERMTFAHHELFKKVIALASKGQGAVRIWTNDPVVFFNLVHTLVSALWFKFLASPLV